MFTESNKRLEILSQICLKQLILLIKNPPPRIYHPFTMEDTNSKEVYGGLLFNTQDKRLHID